MSVYAHCIGCFLFLLFILTGCATEPAAEEAPAEVDLVSVPAPPEDLLASKPAVAADPVDLLTEPEKSKEPAKPRPKPKKIAHSQIVFEETTYDFEELTSGEKTDHKFTFVNEGKAPLEIKNVHVSCGCTVPSYPFIAIEPGEEGYIGVSYNSVGKEGFQRATVRVITNDPKRKEVVLNIEGTVNKKK